MTPAEKRDAALAAANAIEKSAQGRDLTADEITKIDAHLAEAEAAKAEVAAEAARAKASQDARAKLAGYRASAGRKAPAAAETPIVAHESFLDDPMRGYSSHRAFFRDVQRAYSERKVSDQLKSLQAPRLGGQMAAAGSDEHSTFSDPYGGFLVPRETKPGVLMLGYDPDPFAGMTQKVPMSTPSVLLNARVDKTHTTSVSGGLLVYRRAESGSVSASRMQFEQVQLDAHALMGVSYATEEVLRDSPESFASILERGFRDEFAAKAMVERISGDGVGRPLGIAEGPAKIDVAKESGQAAATINYTNLIKMRARCWAYGRAVWYANHDTIPQLFAVTAPGSTIPLLRQDTQGVDQLFGRPIYFHEFAETLGTVGDIVLVVWSEYLEGEYEPIEGASSIHVRFVEHEQAFKFWKRNAGAPWWRSVLTPNKGATLAPVVRLATRA